MDTQDILNHRLISQSICGVTPKKPEEVVYSLGAMQAQDYNSALWAIGLRCNGDTTISDIHTSIDERKIVRTWLMRGTLHFASSHDLRWMLSLFAPRLVSTAKLRDRHLGLSDVDVDRAKSLFFEALHGGKQLTRDELYRILEENGLRSTKNLGYHMLYRAAWDGLICFGSHNGKQPTFALLDEWIHGGIELTREEALGELALRYFTGHGPATLNDFAWWSGLKVTDTRIGILKTSSKLKKEVIGDITYYGSTKTPAPIKNGQTVHLLPAFDEYLVGYEDRSAMLGNKQTREWINSGKAVVHSNGVFAPVIVIDGEVLGTWKRTQTEKNAVIILTQFTKLSREQLSDVRSVVERYGKFFQTDTILKIN
ncbi:MAG: winged helix DNA-binding domain-containing protein [Thermoplasmataceae archaeon]